MAHLSSVERETVIVGNDSDKHFQITTHQRSMVTKLDRLVESGNAKKIQDLSFGKQVGGVYEIPLNMLTLRNPKGKRAKPKVSALKNVLKCGATKADGTICQMIAKKDTGKCRWHS